MLIHQGKQTFNSQSYNEIPDLWHIAQNHPDPVAKEKILKVWHTAHAYMRAINTLNKTTEYAELDVSNS